MLLATALVFELARESLTGTHFRYRKYVDGIYTDEYVTVKGGQPVAGSLDSVREDTTLASPEVRLVGERVARRVVVEEAPHQPYAYDYDVATGNLLRRTPLFFRGKPARVFDPNPVVTQNDAGLQDQNDSAAAVPPSAYFDVTLDDAALQGPHVTLVDRQPRQVPPPEGPFLFDREQDGFEDVNAYFHIDRSQRYLQSLGFYGPRAIVPYAIEVDAHAANGSDDSFFIPSRTEAGKGALFFGEGGTDDAEDADLLVHEYAHAIVEWIAPGTFGGSFPGEARALGEGISDYWAYSAHAAARRASGRDPFCFADWDARCAADDPSQRCAYPAGADCLRRLDSVHTMADYEHNDSSGVEHRNGSIFASALREIHDNIGRQVTDTLVIESLFGSPPSPRFADIARQMLTADRLLYQGKYAGAICSAMYARGILTECDMSPRGEWTLFQSAQSGLAIPENNSNGITSSLFIDDPRAIERLHVRVDIVHPSRGDLQVDLIAPDGTVFTLHAISTSLTPDIRETFGLTAVPLESLDGLRGRTAAGEWRLFVADRRNRDIGTLLSWGLEIQFAGDTPVSSRPHVLASPFFPVGSVYGSELTRFRSDLRLANVTDRTQEATLVFTPSGRNGLEEFSVVRVSLAAAQTVAFDDVVASVFHTAGTGSLEVIGNVLAMSRTDGQTVPPDTGMHGTLLVAPIDEEGTRYNLGITETAGAHGILDVNGRAMTIAPFSHLQFPVDPELIVIHVSGDARIAAYISQIGADAMFIPAEPLAEAQTRLVPVITDQTSGEPLWRSDLWMSSAATSSARIDLIGDGSVIASVPAVFEDVLARLFHRTVTMGALRVHVPAQTFAATRIVSQGRTQFVPLLSPRDSLQHLLFVESSATHRTNIGVVSEDPVTAEIRVFDSAGVEVERQTLFVANGFAQTRVRALVTNGRAEVRVDGPARSYASVIGGDAVFVPSQ